MLIKFGIEKRFILLASTIIITNFCEISGYPGGSGRSSCRSKHELCMEGDTDQGQRPTSSECDDYIRRKYDCPSLSSNKGRDRDRDSDRDRERDRSREEEPPRSHRKKKVDKGDDDVETKPPKRRYEDSEPVAKKKSSRARDEDDDIPRKKYNSEEQERPKKKHRDDDDESSNNDKSEKRGRNKGNNDDEEPYTEVDTKTKTVSDNYSQKYRKSEGNNLKGEDVPIVHPDELRRRDKMRKEKQRIFVKEDLVELDDKDGDRESKVKVEKSKEDPADELRSMMEAAKAMKSGGSNVASDASQASSAMPSGFAKVLQLQKGLL